MAGLFYIYVSLPYIQGLLDGRGTAKIGTGQFSEYW